ncbi:cache domain-containing protein, partial [Kamptonema sp. UHCC 0994]|uniref:cache domain-containing sensor histidine kinase n=1 Tax=Kamptonema sp. UHCC 0994 TaxID=3031329 RepID=UPI0023BAD71E
MSITKPVRQKFRLRTTLVVPFVLQIVAAVGLVGYLSFKNGQTAVYEVAGQLQNEITDRIQQNIKDYLAIPHQINQTNLNAVNMGLNLRELMNLKRYFWPELMSYPNLDFIAFVNNKGNVISGQRLADGTLLFNLCNESTNFNFYAWNATEKGDTTKVSRVIKNFDGRKRLWYQDAVKAGKKSWSQVEISFAEPKMHISAVQPVYAQNGQLEGVLNVTLRLDSISQFLQSLKVGKSGQTFVITQEGVLVATSTSENLVRFNNNKGELFKAIESSDSVTQATARYLIKQFDSFKQIQKLQNLNVEIAGQQRFLQVVPYQDNEGLNWLIVVIVPESDFMEQINVNTRNTIWLTLVALGVAILIGIFTAGLITKPILSLTQASKELAEGNLDRQVETNDAIEIEEIETLEQSFNSMASQLKASFSTLEAQKETLADQNQELHHLDQLKDEFLANTS